MNNIKTWCVIGLATFSLNTYAQEQNLNREMTLEREYDPSVGDANKVNTLPIVREPEVRKTAIDYATQTIPTSPAKEINVLSSGKVMTDIAFNKRRGYLNAGFGMDMNINGDFGYHILSTERDQLNVFISHRSAGGEREYLQSDEKQKVKLNDNIGGLNFAHNFDNAIFSIGAKYGYSAFNYFGYTPDIDIFVPYADVMLFNKEDNQVNQLINVYTGIQSRGNTPIGYHLDLGYTRFDRKHGWPMSEDGIIENAIGIKGGVEATFGGNRNEAVGIDGLVNVFNYSPDMVESGYYYGFDNHLQITLSPYYTVKGNSWNVKLGANVMAISNDGITIAASPNILVDAEVADKTVLYMNAGGGLKTNSMYELSLMNRYVNTFGGAKPSRTWIDAIAGLKSGVAPGFWFDVFAGYNKTDDDVFFTPIIAPLFSNIGNSSLINTLNSSRVFAGAELKYSYQNLFDFSVKGVFSSWNVTYDGVYISESSIEQPPIKFKPYGKPTMEITSTIDIRPINRLTISAQYYMATDRYYSNTEKLENINELNLTSLYSLNDTFGFYAKFSNLLFQKYDLYYGYPTQGFNAMAGVNINF